MWMGICSAHRRWCPPLFPDDIQRLKRLFEEAAAPSPQPTPGPARQRQRWESLGLPPAVWTDSMNQLYLSPLTPTLTVVTELFPESVSFFTVAVEITLCFLHIKISSEAPAACFLHIIFRVLHMLALAFLTIYSFSSPVLHIHCVYMFVHKLLPHCFHWKLYK